MSSFSVGSGALDVDTSQPVAASLYCLPPVCLVHFANFSEQPWRPRPPSLPISMSFIHFYSLVSYPAVVGIPKSYPIAIVVLV